MEKKLSDPSPLNTQESPRQIILDDFELDLPISGGWGYDFSTACIIDKDDPTVDQSIPFEGVEIEYIFAEKRIYEEMIIFRHPDEQFHGIRWDLEKQRMTTHNDRYHDILIFNIVGFSEAIWDELTSRFEEIQKSGANEKMAELDAYRDAMAYRFKREFYFDINSFYGIF